MNRKDLYWELIRAAELDHAKATEILKSHPEMLEHHEYLQETPLHYACVENLHEATAFFLSRGANPNPLNEFGCTPLQEVVPIHSPGSSYLEVIRLLLEAGANPHHRTETYESAWEYVQESEDLKLVGLLRKFANP